MATQVQVKITAFLDDFNKTFLEASKRVTGLGKDVDSTAAKLGRLSNNLESMGNSLALKVTAPLMLIGGIATKNFLEAEKASLALDQALRASGDTTLRNKKSMNDFSTEMQKLTAVEDDTTTGLLAFAMNMGLTATQAKQATKDAIGLNRAFGIDLQAGVKLAGGALQGNYDKLARYIPALKNCNTEAQKAAVYQQAMGNAFAQAEAYAQSGMGKLENLKNSLGNLSESIGKIIFDAIQPLIGYIQSAVDTFSGWDQSTQKTIVIIAALIAGIAPMLMIMSKAVSAYRAFIIVQAAFSAGMAGSVAPTGASTLALVAHKIASIAATIATRGFTAALKANPIGLIVTGLLALVAATVSFVMWCKNSTTAAQKQAQMDRDLADAKRGLIQVMDEQINKSVELQDRALKRNMTLTQAHAEEVKRSNDVIAKSELLKTAVLTGSASDSIKAVEAFNKAIQSSNVDENLKKQTQSMANSMRQSVAQFKTEFKATDADLQRVAAKGLLSKTYTEQFEKIHGSLLKYGSKWKQVADETQQQILDEQQQKRQSANDAWVSEYRKLQDELKKILREHNATEAELNAQKYQDDVDKWFNALQKKQVSYDDYIKVIKAIDEDYATKSAELTAKQNAQTRQEYTNNIQTISSMVNTMGGLFDTYYNNRGAKIDNDLVHKKTALSDEYEAEKAKINASNLDAAAKAKALKQLKVRYEADVETAEAKADKEKKKNQREAAKRQKQFGIFEATMNIPVMAMNGWNAGLQFGIAAPIMAPLLSGIATAFGLAKLALIAQTPLPAYAKGGYANSPSIFGEAGGEVAIPLEDSRSKTAMGILANQLLNQLKATAQVKQPETKAQADNGQLTDIYLDGDLIGKARFAKLKNGEWLTPANSIVTV